MSRRVEPDVWHCRQCGYWRATPRSISPEPTSARLDEDRRVLGLEGPRVANAHRALAILARHRELSGARLCDVGCGHGWFLAAATAQGMTAIGIEPDRAVATAARGCGLDVRVGRFPQCLEDGERFDVVAFHDVLEHLPDVEATLVAVRARLAPHGLLLISVPSSDGILFRAGRLLRRLGVRAGWDRLWQRRFPSPHLHFFNAGNLAALLTRLGFALQESRTVPMVEFRGLWNRARMDRATALPTTLVGVTLVALAYPALRFLPQDAIVQVYGRARAPRRA